MASPLRARVASCTTRPWTLVLDSMLRVAAAIPIDPDGAHDAVLDRAIASLATRQDGDALPAVAGAGCAAAIRGRFCATLSRNMKSMVAGLPAIWKIATAGPRKFSTPAARNAAIFSSPTKACASRFVRGWDAASSRGAAILPV